MCGNHIYEFDQSWIKNIFKKSRKLQKAKLELAMDRQLFSKHLDWIRRQWHPTPVLLPGKSHGRRSLVRLQSMGLHRVGHDWAPSLSLFTCMHWRRKWQPTPVFLPGESQGWGNLVGCRLWGRTESDTTEVTWQQQQQHLAGNKSILWNGYIWKSIERIAYKTK